MQDTEKDRRDDIHSIIVKAGKRTYFFDVKETRKGDYYLTLTESKRVYDSEGNFRYEKHKLFLYKEDFEKFSDALTEAVAYIGKNAPEIEDGYVRNEHKEESKENKEFIDVSFDDLGEQKDTDENPSTEE